MTTTMSAACPAGVSWLRRDGLVAEERGESISEHLQGCPACQQLHGEIEELRASLARMPASEPAPGWQRAVFTRIEQAHKPRGFRWVAALAPLAMTAAAAIALFFFTRGAEDAPGGLSLRFEKGETAMRSRGEVAAGDTLAVAASGVALPVAEVRVYRDDAGLIFRCAGNQAATSACRRDGAGLQARVVLPAVGRYRVLVVSAPVALPALPGSFDADVGVLAGVSGVKVEQADAFEVW